MAYTVREGLHYVYPLIGQHGASASVNTNTLLMTANMAVNMIYNYQGYLRSRQHYKDTFNLSSADGAEYKLISRKPIHTIDKFYTFNWTDVEQQVLPNAPGTPTPCGDCEELKGYECGMCCDVRPNCAPIEMSKSLPHNMLCAGSYAIVGSQIAGMGGINGTIVRAMTPYPTTGLRMTYFIGAQQMKSFDDILPFPDVFMVPRAYFVAGQITPLYGLMMEQQDLNYMSIARKEMDSLKMGDNIFHEEIRFNTSYPMDTKGNFF